MRKFDCDINSLGRIFWERDNVDEQSALIQACPETVSGQVRIWQVYVPAFATPYAQLAVNPDSGGVNIDIADLGGFWVNDVVGNFGVAGGDLFFTGTMTGGSVPAARVDSGTLAIAQSWAYTGGDVTSSAGSAVLTIANNAVSNAKLADMAQATFKMRAAGAGTGDPIDGTAAQAKTALSISTGDVSGLGTIATQNASSVTVGSLGASGGISSSNASNAFFGEGTAGSFSGDIYVAYSANTTGANFYAYRVYNSAASPIAGLRGDGALVAAVMAQAPLFTTPVINKGTVTTAVAIDWRQSAYQTIQLSASTACTMTTTAAPPGPCPIWLKVFSPASGTSLALTYPATFKGGWPTTVTNLSRYNFLAGFYDGTNYNYIGGSLNVA